MNFEDVKALISAGFTADEIRNMTLAPEPEKDTKPEPEKATNPEPEKDTKPEPEKDTKPEPEKATDPVEYMRAFEALRQQIEDLRSTFSAAAVRQDNFGGPDKETVDDVLASIINPKTKKEV